MSEEQKRNRNRDELLNLIKEIEPTKNEEIARKAVHIAWDYLIKSDNQARYIKALERQNQSNGQKPGWWIPLAEYLPEAGCDELPPESWACDQCGFTVHGNKFVPETYRFCPNCGTNMRGI